MKKIKKSMLKSYSVLAIGIALILVGGLSLAVNAQTDKEPTMLDQIMAMYLGLKSGEAPAVVEPVITPAPEVAIGASQRPDVIITKYLDYDDIVTTGVDVTNPVTGDFIVDNVIIETGANTIASGTLFQIYATQGTAYTDYGTSTNVFSTAVVGMTKNITYDLLTPIGTTAGTASTTQRIVLSDGAKLSAKCTTASCKLSQIETELGTASKNMKITVILKPVSSGSSIYE